MTYQRYKRTRAQPMSGMGDISSTILTVADVAANPYFPEMVCRIQQISDIDHGRAVQVCTETMADPVENQSWQRVLQGMRAYSYAQQNQWVYPVALGVLIGLPLWIGYELGEEIMKTTTMLLLGAAAAAGYYLYKRGAAAPAASTAQEVNRQAQAGEFGPIVVVEDDYDYPAGWVWGGPSWSWGGPRRGHHGHGGGHGGHHGGGGHRGRH